MVLIDFRLVCEKLTIFPYHRNLWKSGFLMM